MADGIVAERHVIAIGDNCFITLADGQRNKVIRLALKPGRDFFWNCGDHSLQVERVDRDFPREGITDSVGSLGNGRQPDDFGRTARNGWCGLRHAELFYTPCHAGAKPRFNRFMA